MTAALAGTTFWWLLAGISVAAELVTGTFYLLMGTVGLSAGALAAHLGLGLPAQLVAASVVGGGAVAACYAVRRRRPAAPPAGSNSDVHMDIGQSVMVERWQPDGTAQVRYRGASWTVSHLPGEIPVAGLHRVREVVGSRLVVEKS